MSNLVKIDKFLAARHALMTQSAPPTSRITPERIQKIVVAACNADDKLASCTPESIWSSVQKSIQLGLEPCSPLGHAYLVPFKNKGVAEATLIVGYKGLLVLARRSGEIRSISVGIVRKGDLFKEVRGTDPKIIHEPDESHSGKPTHYYAVVHYVGGGETFEVLTVAEVMATKERSRAGGSGPWVTDFDAMAVKTAIRRALKTAPLSADLADAIETDERNEIDVTPRRAAKAPAESELPPASMTETFTAPDVEAELAAIPSVPVVTVASVFDATPATTMTTTAPAEAPHDFKEEVALIQERIDMIGDQEQYDDAKAILTQARKREQNPLPKEDYDVLGRKLLAVKDALKKK